MFGVFSLISTRKRSEGKRDRIYRLYEDKLNEIISEERFIELSHRCEAELDKEIVHRLIDKITVGNKYVVDGVKKQDIMINYKFVGNVG